MTHANPAGEGGLIRSHTEQNNVAAALPDGLIFFQLQEVAEPSPASWVGLTMYFTGQMPSLHAHARAVTSLFQSAETLALMKIIELNCELKT